MTTIIERVAASFSVAALATTAFAEVNYEDPTFDLSSVQPKFRIGFLGDEAAQDVISRNECLHEYVEATFLIAVKMFTFKDYAGAMESFAGGNLDYTWSELRPMRACTSRTQTPATRATTRSWSRWQIQGSNRSKT